MITRMKALLGRWLGYEQRIALLMQDKAREKESRRAAMEAAKSFRRERDEALTGLVRLSARSREADAIIRKARNTLNLKNSGPRAARAQLTEALNLLEAGECQ